MNLKTILFSLILLFASNIIFSQTHSVARRWNEVMISAIKQDRARPPVQARNLFHFSLAVYDAWAAYDVTHSTVLLGKTIHGVQYPFNGIPTVSNVDSARNIAISYAAYRFLYHRYNSSPQWFMAFLRFDTLMSNLGLDKNYTATNYTNGNPADLGNYIASQVINYGFVDGSNELNDFDYQNYSPMNLPLSVFQSGVTMANINRWQPLSIPGALDQAGNPIPSIQKFICPEWGRVLPFALDESTAQHHNVNGGDFPVYFDPGPPPELDTVDVDNPSSVYYKWGHTMVASWSAHHDSEDTTLWDISPNAIGNIVTYPTNLQEAQSFYNFSQGGGTGAGYSLNPTTGMPYTPQLVKRGDYTRALSQFWADGPESETPPGHWFVILNYVSDQPVFVKKIEGIGNVVNDLEWDVKSYLALGGAMHDAAIACWGIKGYYDSPRPITAIRLMAQYGQSSDSTLPSYHPGGLPLIPGFIELVSATDSLVGDSNQNLNKLKIMSWKGFDSILNASTDEGHVGWILAENWIPYQRKTFITPPFAGYVSGHSTYSRAGATVMTKITGSPYFPNGMSEFTIHQNAGFLVFEKGPSQDVTLQWAKYVDASDECSLSRIWGGIHPPFDDYGARLIGSEIGDLAFNKAKYYFTNGSLPIVLSSFSVIEKNCTAVLNIETNGEINSNYMEVYASEDGKNFNRWVGRIKSSGNAIAKRSYQLIDKNPSAINFYKLTAYDLDGKSQIYPLQTLELTDCNVLQNLASSFVYPNPTKDVLHVEFKTETANPIQIVVFEITGKPIQKFAFKPQVGKNNFVIDTKFYKNGSYLLKVIMDDESAQVHSFQVIK